MIIKSTRKINVSDFPKLQGINEKRRIREDLLTALDQYRNRVVYGEIAETEEEHAAVLDWTERLRDLQDSAFTDIPPKVASVYAKIINKK